VKRLLKFGFRLGVLAVIVAVTVKLLDDRQSDAPVRDVEPRRPEPTPQPDAIPEPAPTEVAWVEPQGDVCPTTHPIKAKLSSKVFRRPNSAGYATSKPDRCYASEDAAIAEGFREAKR
jgi:micrococcal nuclease